MTPGVRTALLALGLSFCVLFGAATIATAFETQFDFLTLISLAIIAMVAIGILGAIRHPPD